METTLKPENLELRGIKLEDSTNVDVKPAKYEGVSIWHNASIIEYKLQALTGYVITRKKGEEKFRRRRQIIPPNHKFELETVVHGEHYHSIVTAKYAAEASLTIPILSVAASMSYEQTVEITIKDEALLYIDDQIIPYDAIDAYLNRLSLDPENFEIYWIQATQLTQVYTKVAKKISTNAKVSGSIYKVNGETYNATETQQRTPYLTLLLIDPTTDSYMKKPTKKVDIDKMYVPLSIKEIEIGEEE